MVKDHEEIKKIMLHTNKDGVCLYLYKSTDDVPCDFDSYFESTKDALAEAKEIYGVSEGDWIEIEDPAPGQKHDIISSS